MELGASEGSQSGAEETRRVHRAWGPPGPGEGRGMVTLWDLEL